MSNWHFDQLKYAVGIGGLMSFYGVVTLIVWFAGANFGLDVTPRVVIIALVLLTLPIALIAGWMISRRRKKAALAQAETAAAAASTETAAPAAQAKVATPAGNYGELTQSAEEVVQYLKGSNLGGKNDAVYALPWYVVAGNPRSGKSSLALASGLNFHNLPSQRVSEQKLIRPTKNVDWRITSEAVLIDTAGRYQTEGVDADEWSALLETIKKHRPTRPLDGLILPVNTERILQASSGEIEQIAKILRSRIDEAMQRVKVRFPIYLVFTHADAIEGFRDSFSVSQREGENLVWGATIPLEKSANAQAMFDTEFDLLHASVMKRRLMRLSAPFPPVRQLKIFNFPIHFSAARKKLGAFVSTLFRPNPMSENPFLRGFYLTAVPVSRQPVKSGQTVTNLGQTVGQTFFTQKLFRDVILRDKDLVATFQAQQVKPPIKGWLLTFLGFFLSFLFLAFTAFSLYQNKQLVDKASASGEKVLAMVRENRDVDPLTKDEDKTRDEIEKLENLRLNLVELDNYQRNDAPFWMRWGLYSGNRLYLEKLLPLYVTVAEQRFNKPTIKKLEDDLRKFAASKAVANSAQLTDEEEKNLEKNYDLLKTYLMLSGEPEYRTHAEPASIARVLGDYWKTESKIPADLQQTALDNVNFWSKQVDRTDANGKFLIALKPDKEVIEAARRNLQAFPPVFRYYKDVTTEISKNIAPISTDSILTGRTSVSELKGGYEVPGAYTVDGYRKYMKQAIAEAREKLNKDSWVMGANAQQPQAQEADIQRLQDKYFNDYIDNWRKFVRGVSIDSYGKDTAAATASLKAFSSAESPMKLVLEEISRQTNLSAEPKSDGWMDWIRSFFKKKQTTEVGGSTAVEKEFRPLFAFTAVKAEDPDKASGIADYGNEIKKLADALEKSSREEIQAIIDSAGSSKNPFIKNLGNVKTAINAKTEPFKATPAGQEIAELLRKPITNLEDLLGAGLQTQIEKEWTNTVLPSSKKAEKGFPFDSNGEADLAALTAYLNPQSGELKKFYDKRLSKYFEEVDGQLKPRENSEVKFSDDFVKYLNSAFRLSTTLYGKNSTPQFGYEFRLQKVEGTTVEITIDGQKTDSNGTGSVSWKFPAQAGETGVLMNVASADEAVTTSAAPPSANSSNTNVSTNTNTVASSPKPPAPSATGGAATSLKFPGNWGLFKFVEAGSPQKQPSGEYNLSYKLGGKTVSATIKPAGNDLFDRAIFTAVRAPEKIIK